MKISSTKALLLFLITIMVYSSNIQATHIIGGQLSYECDGNISSNIYHFTLTAYRDCTANGAQFDNPAIVSFYAEQDNGYEYLGNVQATLTSFTALPLNLDSCEFIPPSVCIEEGVYQFSVELNFHDASYIVSYQRCCRNNTISNILNPDESGMTFTVVISPEAQSVCNNSPVFEDFPPVVVSSGLKFEIPYEATDIDGDSLVYSFCSPLLGGGLLGTQGNPGDPFSCGGVAPNPACPPPYDSIQFLGPMFSSTYPLGGNPLINIDPHTGLITGTPTILGQFVYGVCVSEYRNNTLIGKVFRDFELNVAFCEVSVSVEEQTVEDLRIYPNPTSDFVWIDIPENEQALQLNIRDLSGRTIMYLDNLDDNPLNISLSNLPNGMYVVELTGQKSSYLGRIVKVN